MSRSVPYLWLGFGLLTTFVVLGCRSHRQYTEGEYAPAPAPELLKGLTQPEISVVTPVPVASLEPAKPIAPVAAPEPAKPITPVAATSIVSAVDSPWLPQTPPKPDENIQPVHYKERHDTDRRAFTDITAHPAFDHDPGYHCLVGILDREPNSGWVLRYASLEDDDRYNGHVFLVCTESMSHFHPGDLVRVEGEITAPGSGEALATFRSHKITLVRDCQPSPASTP
jgi:hypothetical protein